MVTATVKSCKIVRYSLVLHSLACSLQLLGWKIFNCISNLCKYVVWKGVVQFIPSLSLLTSDITWPLFRLVMTSHVFNIDVSWALDSLRDHEALYQLCVVAGHSAGFQDTLIASIPCSQYPNNEYLLCHTIALLP